MSMGGGSGTFAMGLWIALFPFAVGIMGVIALVIRECFFSSVASQVDTRVGNDTPAPNVATHREVRIDEPIQ